MALFGLRGRRAQSHIVADDAPDEGSLTHLNERLGDDHPDALAAEQEHRDKLLAKRQSVAQISVDDQHALRFANPDHYTTLLIESADQRTLTAADEKSVLIRPTTEQVALLRHRPLFGERVLVQAFAGSGKTSVCRMLAHRFKGLRILYLAYNRMAAAEARRDMPSNVDARTIHSLAGRYIGCSVGADHSEVPSRPVGLIDESALRSFDLFCRDPTASEPTSRGAKQAWQEMNSGTKPFTYDGMLKRLTMDSDKSRRWLSLHYDMVIVDEFQDSQPAFVEWLKRIDDLLMYAVGDRHQSIYSFNGTINAMQALIDDDEQQIKKQQQQQQQRRLSKRPRSDGEPEPAAKERRLLAASGESVEDDDDDDEATPEATAQDRAAIVDDLIDDDDDKDDDDDEETSSVELVRRHSVTQYCLSRSFRFGDNIGVLANYMLSEAQLLDVRQQSVRGATGRHTTIRRLTDLEGDYHDGRGAIYILARQNGTLIRHALENHATRNGVRVGFFGNAANIIAQLRYIMTHDVQWRRREEQRLWAKQRDPRTAALLDDGERQRMQAFRAIKQQPEQRICALLERIVFDVAEPDKDDDDSDDSDRGWHSDSDDEQSGLDGSDYDDASDDALLRPAEAMRDAEAERSLRMAADVHYGTVHAAKGLEFRRVAVLGDLAPMIDACAWLKRTHHLEENQQAAMMPPRLRRSVGRPQYGHSATNQVREEVNLCYVAVTRARDTLYLNDDLYCLAERAGAIHAGAERAEHRRL